MTKYNMDSLAVVKDDGDAVLGKILYYTLSSVMIDKDKLAQICEDAGFPSGGHRLAPADAFRSATGEISETKTIQGISGAEVIKIYCRDNRAENGIISRELIKETLDASTNRYKKLANLTFSKDCGMSYDSLAYDNDVDPLDYCVEAEQLFEMHRHCVSRKQIETLLESFVDSLQAVKVLAHGKMYFVPREHMHKLDMFEELIRLLEENNLHKGKNRMPMDANSMYVVDDAKQREKMAAAFYRSMRREIADYEERANHLIQTGSQSAAVMDRWIIKIDSLSAKKREYEEVLKRELGELDSDFDSLKTISEELQIRSRGIRKNKIA